MLATEFGEKYNSCEMDWRRSLGPEATQADAYAACERGDYLIWQFRHGLNPKQLKQITPQLVGLARLWARREVRRAVARLKGRTEDWIRDYRRWARNYLSGKDTSTGSVERAAWAAWAEEEAWAAWAEEAARAARAAWVAWEAESAAWAAWEAARVAERAAWVAESAASAERAARAERAATMAERVAESVARAERAEQQLQAKQLKRLIPIWPGE